jgi:hypothetical protein
MTGVHSQLGPCNTAWVGRHVGWEQSGRRPRSVNVMTRFIPAAWRRAALVQLIRTSGALTFVETSSLPPIGLSLRAAVMCLLCGDAMRSDAVCHEGMLHVRDFEGGDFEGLRGGAPLATGG